LKLNILHEVPKDLYTTDVTGVHRVLGGPTLLHLQGEIKDEPLFLSTLLHGNETTSFLVLQKLLNEYKDKKLPRTLLIFIGNTLGASRGQRHLPDQPDYNRIWEEGKSDEHLLATQVFVYAKQFKLFANIDIHNNTGKNPHYACINTIHDQNMHLASLFGKEVVYFTEPSSVQSLAFAELCPSVTLEAGLPGAAEGTSHVYEFISEVLKLTEFKSEFDRSSIDIYHTIGRILVDKKAKLDFTNDFKTENDISFIHDFDELNFTDVPARTVLGYISNPDIIRVVNNKGEDMTSEYLQCDNGQLVTTQTFIPSMFSKDIYVVKEDCVGYVMERMFPEES
jgi:succinylglutamate desuccinylase